LVTKFNFFGQITRNNRHYAYKSFKVTAFGSRRTSVRLCISA